MDSSVQVETSSNITKGGDQEGVAGVEEDEVGAGLLH